MSNDLENGFLRSENSQLSREVARERQENDFLRSQLAHSATTAQQGGVMARMARERIRELEAQLAEAQATIAKKDELLVDWISSQKAMKAVATKVIDEGASHPDVAAHPYAHNKELRQSLFDEVKTTETAKLRLQYGLVEQQ